MKFIDLSNLKVQVLVLITSVIASQISNCITQNLCFPIIRSSAFKVLSLSQPILEMLMAASSFKPLPTNRATFIERERYLILKIKKFKNPGTASHLFDLGQVFLLNKSLRTEKR